MPKSRGNGEGSIYYSESKQMWVSQFSYGRKYDGSRYRKTFYGKTRKAVKEKLEKFTAEVNAGTATTPSNATLSSLGAEIINNEYKLNILGDVAYIRKKATLAIIERSYIASTPIKRLSDDDITVFLSSITNYSNSQINKICSLLKKIFSIAVEKNVIATNPMLKSTIKKPRSQKETRKVSAFTIEEQKLLIKELVNPVETLCNDYRTQMLTSIFTGMRMGEINALSVSDIDLNNGTVNISRTVTKDINDKAVIGSTTKTYAGKRELNVSSSALKALKDYIESSYKENEQGLLFYNFRNNSVISTSQVNIDFKRLCAKIGIEKDVNQHMLRHTFATRCIEAEMPAKVLQKILGHADIKTTLNTYCDVFEAFESKHIINTEEYLKNNGLSI